MNVRKEQIVFAVTSVALAALAFAVRDDAAPRPSRAGKGNAPTLEPLAVPEVERALPRERDLTPFDRDVFSQPRDTRPLPALELELAPMPPLSALAPPPEPGPAPRLFGRFLRADATPREVAGLFGASDDASASALDDDEDGGALGELQAAAKAGEQKLGAEELAQRVESWKRLYDWIRIHEGRPLFGYIRNEDRFGLALKENTDKAISFVEVDPETGRERFPGQPPVAFERGRVIEFALASTFENQIQIRRRELARSPTQSQYAQLLAFADECVRRHREARRALEVAEEMYRIADQLDTSNDPAARLGLARCYEAGFEFDRAFEVYESLLADGFAHRAEVHVRLGELEARFRLFDAARARFEEAERLARTDWSVQWPYGRFLLERGDVERAVEHLQVAYKAEPGNEFRDARAGIRYDLGRALLATGEVEPARDLFEKALQADANLAGARAGSIACSLLGGKTPAARERGEASGFEEIFDRALVDLAKGAWAAARDGFELAASADPLRAGRSHAALSWLAEITGHAEEAFRRAELAFEADPTDPWTLYQRGRLFAQRDDVDGARQSLQAALDRELDFVDALAAIGRIAFDQGEREAAERYLERALRGDDARAELHGLRGWNALLSGDVAAAEAAFQLATRIAATDPVARTGLAWCAYRRGQVESATQLFADVVDARRAQGEQDPFTVYANRQIARITDHASKVIWTDRFERRQLMNQWLVEEAAGPTLALDAGELVLAGNFKSNGETRAFREWPPAVFYALDLDVRIDPQTKAKVGVFLSKERPMRGGDVQTLGKIAVARHPEGGLQLLVQDRADNQEQWTDVAPVGGVPWWPTDRAVHVRIERAGEGSEAIGRVTIDGVVVAEGFRMTALASTNQNLRVGVFAQGATGRPVRAVIDNVEVTYRAQP